MWLVVALPTSAVLAGLVTAWIAVQGADVVLNEKASVRAPRAHEARPQESAHGVNRKHESH